MQLLRSQQNIHETEVMKWLKILEVAVTLIQNVWTLSLIDWIPEIIFILFQTEKTLVELLGQIQLQEIIEAHSKDKSHRNMQFFNENKV